MITVDIDFYKLIPWVFSVFIGIIGIAWTIGKFIANAEIQKVKDLKLAVAEHALDDKTNHGLLIADLKLKDMVIFDLKGDVRALHIKIDAVNEKIELILGLIKKGH